MSIHTKSKPKVTGSPQTTWYKGRQAKTGNSLGLRFDKALFQSHPEFNGVVEASIIAPGRMLVVADQSSKRRREEDPVVASFLSFLAADMIRNPRRVVPLDKSLMRRIDRLVADIDSDPDEDLGDETVG